MEVSRASLHSPASFGMLEARVTLGAGERGAARASSRDLLQEANRDRNERFAQSRVDPARQVLGEDPAPESRNGFTGSIEFEVVEGAKVMKVLDSKDVLIYQVPSKGQLALVKVQEAAEKRAGVVA